MFRIHFFLLRFVLFTATIIQNICLAANNNLLNRLNNIIPTQGPVYIITATRSLGSDIYGVKAGYLGLSLQRFNNLKQTLQNLCSGTDHNSIPRNSLKIVVFNECFFQKYEPLEKGDINTFGTKDYFLNELKNISQNCPNTILYPNFLYKETFSDTTRQREILAQNISNHPSNSQNAVFLNFDFQFPSPVSGPNAIFRNVTYGILNGQKMTKYKKRTYWREYDKGILFRGWIYDFGDGKDHITLNGQQPIVTNLVPRLRIIENISTEICFDLAHGVRRSNNWVSANNYVAVQSVLHLIQSNCINPIDVSNGNITQLPKDKLIVHADPEIQPIGGYNLFSINNGIPVYFSPHFKILLNSNTSDKINLNIWKID